MFETVLLETADLSTAQWVLLGIGLAGLVVVLFRVDDRVEKRRRTAIKSAAQLEAIGLRESAEICQAYAVGDHTGVIKTAGKLIARARSEGGAARIAAACVRKALPGLLDHPEHGPELRKLIEKEAAKQTAQPSGGRLSL